MDFIKGFTFGFCATRGSFYLNEPRESLKKLRERTSSEYVIFALAALQDTAHSTDVDYTGEHMVSDDELISMINYAKSLGFKIILKPLVNVRNGTWRAHINFFDIDVPCEPKWSQWFESYGKYQCHYAKIAEQTKCDMFIVGCEMVQTERREIEWRKLIHDVRQHYSGLISYNTDKYQEDNVKWWDAVDIISSSGYYPIDDWENQLGRIEKIIKRYSKPFFFAEAGCSSKRGASYIPNDWTLDSLVDLDEQKRYYEKMFEMIIKYPWVKGLGLWDWSHNLYPLEEAHKDCDYNVYGKPAEEVVKSFYSNEKIV